MPFDYMHAAIPEDFYLAPEKALEMYRTEIRERAALLRRLGYSLDDAIIRLRSNLAWDWECNDAPSFITDLEQGIEALVEEVY